MDAAPYFGVIDIGNSGIKTSLAETKTKKLIGEVRSIHWLLPADQKKKPPSEFNHGGSIWASIDDLNALTQMIEEMKFVHDNPDQNMLWLVSSVQPQAIETFKSCLSKRFSTDDYRIVNHLDIPLKCNVDSPESVGIDRLLAAWGAWNFSEKKGPLIVIQAGTAVTVDWVNEQGVYCGGAILPGLSLTLKYLALGTAHLPWLAPPKDPRDLALPGRNTREAILAGVTASFIGGIELLQRRYREQYLGNPNEIETIVSGGDGLTLSRSISSPFKIIDHLVLNAIASLDVQAEPT